MTDLSSDPYNYLNIFGKFQTAIKFLVLVLDLNFLRFIIESFIYLLRPDIEGVPRGREKVATKEKTYYCSPPNS